MSDDVCMLYVPIIHTLTYIMHTPTYIHTRTVYDIPKHTPPHQQTHIRREHEETARDNDQHRGGRRRRVRLRVSIFPQG